MFPSVFIATTETIGDCNDEDLKLKKKNEREKIHQPINEKARRNIYEQSLFSLSALDFFGVNVQLVAYASQLG